MGMYLNPGNSGFTRIRNDIYVDKSGLISLINETIETPRFLTCVSRPRRFGKSFAAKMLCAYYDKTCDSSALFDDLVIAQDEKFNRTYRQQTEVKKLCEEYHCDFEKMKRWYDGYWFRDTGSVYNPNSVMEAIRNDDFDSYWTQTSAAGSLMGYISMDFDGLSVSEQR